MVQFSQVSSLGRFRSTKGVVSTPAPLKSGYVLVKINKKGYQIHRLIAAAFDLPRRLEQETVDHIDNDPSNNRLSNLRWASRAEQVSHSYSTNTSRKSNAGRRSKPVMGRKVGTEAWATYESAHDASRSLLIDSGSVSACCNKKQKTAGGYEFEFADPTEPDTLEGEEWRDTIDKAQISSFGRFRSTKGVVSTPAPTKSGYVRVKINKNKYQIHRLIAAAFDLPRRLDQETVDHIDNDPSNNRLSNLRWASRAEQVSHSYSTNTSRKSNAGRRSKPVMGRKVGTEAWATYESAHDASRSLLIDSGSVSACCNKKQKTVGGYEFEFADPTEPDTLDGEEWRDVRVDDVEES